MSCWSDQYWRRLGFHLAPWLLALIGVAFALVLVPFSAPMPAYLVDAREFAANGRIAGDFRPIGYSLLIGAAFRAAGIAGIVAFQSVVYVSTVVAAYHVARRVCDIHWLVLVATSLVAFHPYVLLDIKRITDNAMNVLVTLAIVAFVFFRRQFSIIRIAELGIALAILFTSRPNALVFGLLPVVATVFEGFPVRGLLTIAITFITTWMIISSIATGNPFFVSDNGPYNLFAGSNQFTRQSLLSDLNAESSIGRALAARGATSSDPAFVTLSLGYVVGHPSAWIGLLGLKMFTLFRPDWRRADTYGKWLVQSALALPVVFWFLVALKSRARWDATHWLFVVFLVLYVAPFSLTNADPRFRLSLDISFLLDAVRRLRPLSLVTTGSAPHPRFSEPT
jgi:hypothetical protein